MSAPGAVLRTARNGAGLSQRGLAVRAGTCQSVVARIEGGLVSPTWGTLERLLAAAGQDLVTRAEPAAVLDRQELDDVGRILGLDPEARLREVANVSQFLCAARRA